MTLLGNRRERLLVALVLSVLGASACAAGCRNRLPPVEAGCKSDSDCALDRTYIRGNESCCLSCRFRAVSRSWAARVEKLCDKLGRKGCPQKKCAAQPSVACRKSRCVTVPAR